MSYNLCTVRAFLALCLFSSLASAKIVTGKASKYTFYNMLTPLAGPCDACEGPDGALWVQDQFVNKIARVDPATGLVEEFDVPYTIPASTNITGLPDVDDRLVLSCATRPGRDGNVYAANGLRNQLLRVNTTTRHIDVFTPPNYNPLGDLQPFNDLYSSEDGVYFSQTTSNQISFFDFATENITSYTIPTPESGPLGMFVASDGKVYVAEFFAQQLARFDPKTKTFQEFPLPATLAGPAVIRAETQNRYVWFTALLGNAIGRFDMKTLTIKAYTYASPLSLPAEDTVDSKGRIWFSTIAQSTLNYLVPSTGNFTTIKQPKTLIVAPLSLPFDYTVNIQYGPGNAIWFTEGTANRVGRYSLD